MFGHDLFPVTGWLIWDEIPTITEPAGRQAPEQDFDVGLSVSKACIPDYTSVFLSPDTGGVNHPWEAFPKHRLKSSEDPFSLFFSFEIVAVHWKSALSLSWAPSCTVEWDALCSHWAWPLTLPAPLPTSFPLAWLDPGIRWSCTVGWVQSPLTGTSSGALCQKERSSYCIELLFDFGLFLICYKILANI